MSRAIPALSHRLKDEPRFRGLQVAFPEGIDAAFADQRQVYLFKGDSFHIVIGDEDNYKQYDNSDFINVQAALQERGENYILSDDTWYQTSHLEARELTKTAATPRTVQAGGVTAGVRCPSHDRCQCNTPRQRWQELCVFAGST